VLSPNREGSGEEKLLNARGRCYGDGDSRRRGDGGGDGGRIGPPTHQTQFSLPYFWLAPNWKIHLDKCGETCRRRRIPRRKFCRRAAKSVVGFPRNRTFRSEIYHRDAFRRRMSVGWSSIR